MHRLEPRLLLAAADPPSGFTTPVNESQKTIAGFRLDYAEYAYGGAGLWIYGPDTDDTIRISRSASLPRAIDVDFNGTLHTINFDQLASVSGWGLSAGGGKNKIEVTFAAAEQNVSGFSGFQL